MRVEQVHGERLELRQPRDELRNLLQQLVEVEHRRDFASELEERDDELADVRGGVGGVRVRSSVAACQSRTRDGRSWPKYNLLGPMDLTLPLDYAAIERILPHRYPFLLVDRITEFEVDKRIVGIKNVSLNERYLSRDADGSPVLPPTILTEAVAQVGAIMILAKPENRQRLPFFAGIERVRYRRPVRPGDVVEIEAVVAAAAQPHGTAEGRRARQRQARRRRHDDVRARPAAVRRLNRSLTLCTVSDRAAATTEDAMLDIAIILIVLWLLGVSAVTHWELHLRAAASPRD